MLWQSSPGYSLGQCVPVGLIAVEESLSVTEQSPVLTKNCESTCKICPVFAQWASLGTEIELHEQFSHRIRGFLHAPVCVMFWIFQFNEWWMFWGIPAQPLSLASLHLNTMECHFPRQVIFVKTKGKATEHENLALLSHWKSLCMLCLASTSLIQCWMPGH